MAGKTFKVAARRGRKTIPFTLEVDKLDENGEPTGETETHEFHSRDEIPGNLLLDVAGGNVLGNDVAAVAMQKFFHYVIVPADRARWQKVVDESDPPVSLEMLNEIVEYLMTEINERPTESANSSSESGTPPETITPDS